jgi:signal transduction histidine kinase
LRLMVRDDGVGFDPDAAMRDAASGHSSGLPNMTDRAHLANGTLSIRSSRGMGTTIEVRLPLSDTTHTSTDNT